ncbi:hypothetical protein FA13DRAFT_1759492 [Coprinellus micaceus]|uniref:Uncharacterized protein n=1 Tax=Coprinellus micaceus TaxID=71717 RepID=A0A4Y7RYP4_COPMI|nr:hypothetical protein FA13DRAFT_1759492 [Coprinellus micaceus]
MSQTVPNDGDHEWGAFKQQPKKKRKRTEDDARQLASKGGGRNKRGGRKTPQILQILSMGKEGARLMTLSRCVLNPCTIPQEQSAGRARNPTGINQHSAANAEARAYRNSHAYAVSQQPLLTSWEVRSTSNNPNAPRSDSTDMTMERGVKVKWPSKRMSVGDMNKRVRALVEWRERRREALEKELHEPPPLGMGDVFKEINKESTSATMREMEELMEELIGFQERFGPGAKTRERERRQGV